MPYPVAAARGSKQSTVIAADPEVGIVTGTYTGNGTTQTITMSFVPQLVFVAPANGDSILWRHNTAWHGRSQHFLNLSSEYAIRPASGQKSNPFTGNGFTVEGDANQAGVAYHWMALFANNTGEVQATSWIGNALTGRALDWTDGTPDAVFVKRDAERAAQWKLGAGTSLSSVYQDGAAGHISAFTTTGITVTDSITVNENDNVSSGEGIEGVAFFEGDTIDLVTYTGDGNADRLIATAFQPAAAFVFDCVNDNSATTDRHVFVTDTMAAGNAKQFGGSLASGVIAGLEAGGVRLGTDFNANGRAYAVLAFKASTAVQYADSFDRSGKTCLVSDGELITLDDYPALSGACSMEWFGRADFGFGGTLPPGANCNNYIPLILLGNAPIGTLATQGATYNGGLYLAHFVRLDWTGVVLRVVHTDYLSVTLAENSINYYSMNTGVVVPQNTDFHVVTTHDGSGHWQVWLNGAKVKDYNVDLDQATYGNRTNGGTGVAKTVRLLSGNIVDSGQGSWGRCYRTQVWAGTQLTPAQAVALYDDVIVGGTAYAGPSATKAWDFRDGVMPDDVTISGHAELQAMNANENDRILYFDGKGSGIAATAEPQGNGDVWAVTAVGSSNGRIGFWLPAGRSISLRSRITYDGASRLIGRYSATDQTGSAGTSVFDVTGTGTLDRTDTFTTPDNGGIMWFIGITTAGEKFVVHPETAWEYA